MTQQQVAKQLGVSTQQMHKYESGINGMSVGQLFVVARAFDVAVAVPSRPDDDRLAAYRTAGATWVLVTGWIDQLRRTVGPPWAQDQKLAALASWIALARSS